MDRGQIQTVRQDIVKTVVTKAFARVRVTVIVNMKKGDMIVVTKEWAGQVPSPVTVGKEYEVVATHMNPNIVNIIDDEGDELELSREHWKIVTPKKKV